MYNVQDVMLQEKMTNTTNQSACTFTKREKKFEGPHKEQKTSQSNWLPVRESDIPDPHPAKVSVKHELDVSVKA